MAFFSRGVQARTYTISNNTMAVANDGICGFREALVASSMGIQMNECPMPDGIGTSIINLAPLTYTAPVALEVWNHVTIRCPTGTCIIDAGNLNSDLFTILSANNPNVTLYRLTFRQPSANSNSISGVVVQGGIVKLQESSITGFRFAGLSIQAGSNHEIQRSTFTGNGRGIYLMDGIMALSSSNTISNNTTGIRARAVSGFTDVGSVISNNSQAGIDFITSGGQLYLTNTTISGNRNRGISLGLSTNAYLTNCTIDRNTTSGNGAGMHVPSNFTGASAFVVIKSSTFSNNRAQGDGGGLYVNGTCALENCTLSNDTAARGGGAFSTNTSTNSYLWLTHCTIAYNRATVSGGGVTNIPHIGDGDVAITNTIIAQNTAPMHPDMSGPSGSTGSLFGNLSGSTGDHSADLSPGNPLLGALVDNAGPNRVMTRALLPGSPAINKVSPSLVFSTDQRGFPRPTSGSLSWDVGAYEVMPFETELLTVASSQGWHAPQDDASLSNGAGTVMRSGAVGNYVTYVVAVPDAIPAGTNYKIEIGARTSPDGAIIELATAPMSNPGVFTRIGEVDMYSSASKVAVLPPSNSTPLTFNFTSPGIKHFRLKITGRNPANSIGYFAFFDYIRITKQ